MQGCRAHKEEGDSLWGQAQLSHGMSWMSSIYYTVCVTKLIQTCIFMLSPESSQVGKTDKHLTFN